MSKKGPESNLMKKTMETRDRILLATLPHVAFDGWTKSALDQGVADAGLSPDHGLRAFPEGIADLVGHFSHWADRRMLARLDGMDLENMRVRDRVAAGVRSRLEELTPHREAVRRLFAYLALPLNAPLTLRLSYDTLDAIWHAAGDRSADFNFYTKRGLLAPVYATTVLYWLGDNSNDFSDTWGYLDRRLANVLAIPRLQARLKQALSRFTSAPPGWRPPRRGRGPKTTTTGAAT